LTTRSKAKQLERVWLARLNTSDGMKADVHKVLLLRLLTMLMEMWMRSCRSSVHLGIIILV
jgi:hypothetical protein